MDKEIYDSSNIRVLQGLEAVRKRPAMYIGSTDIEGLHHLFTELLDNAVDEAIAGYCNHINVILHKDGSLEVSDNGRGIPIDIHPQTKVSTLETVMTNLHAGGKFDKGAYKVSGGLHGVGLKCTNALSEWMETTVYRDGKEYKQRYERGVPKSKVEEIGTTKLKGTKHVFKPDEQIFKESTKFSFKRILEKCRQHAYLTAALKLTIKDERGEGPSNTYQFYFEDGVKSYVKFMNLEQKAISEVFYVKDTDSDVIVETAIQYTDSLDEMVYCYTNNINNPEGGTHLAGFRGAITSAINTYAETNELLKGLKNTTLGGDDVREGLTAIISVKVPDPQFEGQTKIKLNNPEVKGIVQRVVKDALVTYFNENPNEAKNIIGKAVLAFKARAAAKAARDAVIRKGALESTTLPGKLSDCQSKDASECELYIVEGDSAGGCFSGDTKVALLDGRSLSFLELIKEQKQGIQNFCYTINSSGDITVAPIKNVRRTKQGAKVIKISLDNGETLLCTPDHKFMLRDFIYKQAQNLNPTDSLMPLYRKLSEINGSIAIKGYEMMLNPSTHKWRFTHIISDNYNLENRLDSEISGSDRHHIDFHKYNNNPTNIKRLPKSVHMDLHMKSICETLLNEENKEKARKSHQTIEYREKIRALMSTPRMKKLSSERAKKQWENEEYKEYMQNKYLAFYFTHEEYREKNNLQLNHIRKIYWQNKENRVKQSQRISSFFNANPELKNSLSDLAKKQWNNNSLREWRAKETKKQWTEDFRAKRLDALNTTYLNKSIKLVKSIIENANAFSKDWYEAERRLTNDTSILKLETLANRFFSGDYELLLETATHYNHKIVKIEKVDSKIDVFDLEVPITHNFALASGVFVHNSARQGRDRKTQAVLPLRGKIINSHKYRVDKVLANNEFKDIVTALGVGIGETLNVDNLRYHKIIIMSDADVDGSHITTLVLTLLFRFFKPLIEKGYVYVAQTPLYKVEVGKERQYFIGAIEKNAYVEKVEASGKKAVVNRFKGLGEMNPEQLRETSMDKANRVLKRVNIVNAQEAEKVFEILMGIEVAPRKRFIQKYAKLANLDV